MGGGVSRAERREKEVKRHRLLKAVERFVINVYATCPRMESMRFILSSEMASRAFGHFVESERADENLHLYNDILEIRKTKVTPYQLCKHVERIVQQYVGADTAMQVMVSEVLRNDFVEMARADRDDPHLVQKIWKLFDRLLDECIFLMARDQFHRFILSKYYKSWRAAESYHAIAHTTEDASKGIDEKGLMEKNIYSMSHTPNKSSRRKRSQDLSVRAFANVDVYEIGTLLGSESWLAALLAAVEALPICFSLATGRKDRRGFPLMYVNKYFERVTGYSRAEALGKSCRFLQCSDSEPESIAKFSEALRLGNSAQIIITNMTVDRIKFKNLVSIKPVFDDQKRLCYVMATHIDVTKEVDGCVAKMKLAADLMEMLPQLILTDDDDAHSPCLPI